MKILLLGANGQVGSYLRHTLSSAGTVVASSRCGFDGALACDLTRPGDLRDLLLRQRPDLVVNAAAYTAVDLAERERDAAIALNADVPRIIGDTVAAWHGGVIHFSTDYVFDGRSHRPYLESDGTGPLGVYGQTKLMGEDALAASGADYLILRTAWVYSLRGRNFLTTMLQLAGERPLLRVVDDQRGTPTSAGFVARATAGIVTRWATDFHTRNNLNGVYHLTAKGETTWFRFAQAIFAEAHSLGVLAQAPTVIPIPSADYPTPAARPAYSVLDIHKLEDVLGVIAPEWRSDLARVIASEYER
ncbi:dTDP-4-dehydrorhamnose reductase [Dyella halodurans]|uniref:dTDP-4-dehydrorhamnose reductase n=1 Tax=Dyella halodurans TaxID=1920171 RepID=A0ABV9BX14_9GAMM|nr:dTDP-4-dehydrorhamnose reductase [Dyella halodurans]